MTEHTRESDELLLIEYAIKFAGAKEREAAERLKENASQGESVYCECDGWPTPEELEQGKCDTCGNYLL